MNRHENYEKGIALEQEFCLFMQQSLGYREVHTRLQMRSYSNPKNTNVDVVGKRLNKMGKLWERLTIVICFCPVGFFLGAIFNGKESYQHLLAFATIGMLIISLTIAALWLFRKKYYTEFAWAECKVTKGSSTQLSALISQCDQYRKSKDRAGAITDMYFVSDSFSNDTIAMAKVSGVKCFIRTEMGQFMQV